MKYQRYILNRFTRFTTTLFIIVALFSFCSLRQATAGWQIEVVDPRAGLLEGDTSLAFDLSGNPAISYGVFFSVTIGGGLNYAQFNGATWDITSVIRAGPLVGINNSLAFDFSSNPAISLSGGIRISNAGLALARFDGTTWNSTLVDPANLRSGKDSLAFDLSGNPAIAYHSVGNLKFATFNGTSWDITTVDSTGNVARSNSLAFDPSGNPAISYYDIINGDLQFAKFNGTSWDITTVDSTGDVGIFNSLAFDTSGNPAISYFDETNSDLKFARFNGTTWDITTVDSAGNVGSDNSLAFDAFGNPAISYLDGTNGDLKFARFNGASWDITTVDSAGGVGTNTSLAFDATGNPAISYRGFTNSDSNIKFARFFTTTTSTTTTTTTTTSTTTTTFVCQCPASGNGGCISGTVTEVGTEEPLLGKTVILKRTSPRRPRIIERIGTGNEGCYIFTELEDGVYKIKVRRCRGGGRKTIVVVDGLLRNDVNFECR